MSVNMCAFMERCIYKYMYNYFISNKLIYEKQAGFLTGHSTVFQLINLYHQIAQSFDSKMHTCVVFCDISKALTGFGTRDLYSN